jgi:hypothetical protein
MPLLEDDVQVYDAPPQAIHAPMTPSQSMPMQSMGSMEVDPPISMNKPLTQIIILKPNV